MIVLDIGLLVLSLLAIAGAYVLIQTLQTLRAAKKYVEIMQKNLAKRDELILRLTHELEKHGCDDVLLIEEARQICETEPGYDASGRRNGSTG